MTDVLYDPKHNKLWLLVGFTEWFGNRYETYEDGCLVVDSSLVWNSVKGKWLTSDLCKRLVYIGEL